MKTAAAPTLYDVLQVSEDASEATIRSAYRRLVKTAHPDLFPDAEKADAQRRFVALQQAYEVLRDENQRAVYNLDLRTERNGPTRTEPSSRPDPAARPYRTEQPQPNQNPVGDTGRVWVGDASPTWDLPTEEPQYSQPAAPDAKQSKQNERIYAAAQADSTPGEYRRRIRERSAVLAAALTAVPLLIARFGLASWVIALGDPTSDTTKACRTWEQYWQVPSHGTLALIIVVVAVGVGMFNERVHTFMWNLYLVNRPWRVVTIAAAVLIAFTSPYWVMWPDTAPIVGALILVLVWMFTTFGQGLYERILVGRTLNPLTWVRWALRRRWYAARSRRAARRA